MKQKEIDEKIADAGDIERKYMNIFFDYLNETNKDNYTYEIHHTISDEIIHYDGYLIIRDENDKIISDYIVETKIRTKPYNELILEQQKLNNLIKDRNTKFVHNSWGRTEIMYLNFCPNGIYMFFPELLKEDDKLPKPKSFMMNSTTVASRTNKRNKKVYLLDLDLGIKRNIRIDNDKIIKLPNEKTKNISKNDINKRNKRVNSIINFLNS